MHPSLRPDQTGRSTSPEGESSASRPEAQRLSAPSISRPQGGGAIRGIGEKFTANPVTGTGSLTVPIATSPGRSGFGPQLSLSYDSGAGNSPFGIGWNLSLPAITRKADKGLPKYRDADESDVFILSGAEDLVPVFKSNPDGTLKTRRQTKWDSNPRPPRHLCKLQILHCQPCQSCHACRRPLHAIAR